MFCYRPVGTGPRASERALSSLPSLLFRCHHFCLAALRSAHSPSLLGSEGRGSTEPCISVLCLRSATPTVSFSNSRVFAECPVSLPNLPVCLLTQLKRDHPCSRERRGHRFFEAPVRSFQRLCPSGVDVHSLSFFPSARGRSGAARCFCDGNPGLFLRCMSRLHRMETFGFSAASVTVLAGPVVGRSAGHCPKETERSISHH